VEAARCRSTSRERRGRRAPRSRTRMTRSCVRSAELTVARVPGKPVRGPMNHDADRVARRPCPYCLGDAREPFGVRQGATFGRCTACRSIFMDLRPAGFERLHATAFSDEGFVADIASERAAVPSFETWREFGALLPPGPVLEVGPGSGHLLAAA